MIGKLFRYVTAIVAVAAVSAMAPTNATVPPRGSYKATCRDLTMDGSTLKAKCYTRDDEKQYTELPYATDCKSGVVNLNGNLACKEPAGSWQKTCRDYSTDKASGAAKAECENSHGEWVPARSEPSGRYVNCDGELKPGHDC